MIKFIKQVKNSEFSWKLREKLYPKYYSTRFTYPELPLKNAMKRYQACLNPKKKSQIKKEIHLYKKFWNCYPYDYFLSDLYRADNQITEHDLINYIPGFFWYYLYLPHHTSYINGPIIDNKIITDQMFKSLQISQPETYCKIINQKLYSDRMEQLPFDQVIHSINKNDPGKLFVKPAEGSGGKGFYIFNKTGEGSYITRENVIFNKNFLIEIGKRADFIVQVGVTQDPELSYIYPDSVNTCRIITENKDGDARVVCAMMRIGRNHLEVDNVSSGGLCIKIDIRNGKVGDYAISYENEKFVEQPDTHFIFKNFKISRWDEIQKFVIKSAEKLPYFGHLGWDIALTKDGPLAIEANLGMGIEAQQMADGGLREAFGIDNPDYYWKNRGKRG
jgi:hypothetical protein